MTHTVTRRATRRAAAVAGAAGLAILALGACGVSYAAPADQSGAPSADPSAASTSAPAGPSVAPDAAVYKDCVGVLDTMPTMVTWSCGTPTSTVDDITWSTWGATTATGAGTLGTPTGPGTPVTVELSSPGGDDHHFTALTITTKGGKAQTHNLP
ncbi:hypothetical protein [Tsukamurella soli]|uniref:Ig-like domain-containing protein n=1 Tax=Tsukamurella soli TaxID=644556 RepID=A0ABP8JF43_9ACTN